jgi:membrane protein required for colicin V production
MNGLDIAILVLVGLSTLLGAYWGLIRQVLAIGGLIAGIALAGRYYQTVADVLAGITPATAPNLLNLIAFVLIMTLVSLAVSVIATLLRLFIGLLFLGWLDHLLGAVLGFVQASWVVAALLSAIVAFPAVGLTEQLTGSRLAPWWSVPVRWSLPLMPEQFQTPNELMFGSSAEPRRAASMRRPISEW